MCETSGYYYGSLVNLYGNITNLATVALTNLSLSIKGDFINKDTIHTYVIVETNIQNQGYWNCYETKFTGAGNKHISQSAGHPFGGTQLVTDHSGAKIILDSDIEFTMPVVHLDNDTLSCGNYKLTAYSSFNDGTIADGEIKGASDFWNPNFTGSLILNGNHRFANGVVNGIVENRGSMEAITYYGGYFQIFNHLINKNSIQSMNLKVFGNLTNYGTIDNNSVVQIVGDATQYINLLSSIESPTKFYCDETGHNYQWMKNGVDILNQTAAILNFGSLQLSDAGVYQCRYISGTGTTEYSREIIVNLTTTLVEKVELLSNISAYPNPFIGEVFLSYSLNLPASVIVTLFNANGVRMNTLENSFHNTGTYTIKTTGNHLSPGVYVIQLEVNTGVRKLIKTVKLVHN